MSEQTVIHSPNSPNSVEQGLDATDANAIATRIIANANAITNILNKKTEKYDLSWFSALHVIQGLLPENQISELVSYTRIKAEYDASRCCFHIKLVDSPGTNICKYLLEHSSEYVDKFFSISHASLTLKSPASPQTYFEEQFNNLFPDPHALPEKSPQQYFCWLCSCLMKYVDKKKLTEDTEKQVRQNGELRYKGTIYDIMNPPPDGDCLLHCFYFAAQQGLLVPDIFKEKFNAAYPPGALRNIAILISNNDYAHKDLSSSGPNEPLQEFNNLFKPNCYWLSIVHCEQICKYLNINYTLQSKHTSVDSTTRHKSCTFAFYRSVDDAYFDSRPYINLLHNGVHFEYVKICQEPILLTDGEVKGVQSFYILTCLCENTNVHRIRFFWLKYAKTFRDIVVQNCPVHPKHLPEPSSTWSGPSISIDTTSIRNDLNGLFVGNGPVNQEQNERFIEQMNILLDFLKPWLNTTSEEKKAPSSRRVWGNKMDALGSGEPARVPLQTNQGTDNQGTDNQGTNIPLSQRTAQATHAFMDDTLNSASMGGGIYLAPGRPQGRLRFDDHESKIAYNHGPRPVSRKPFPKHLKIAMLTIFIFISIIVVFEPNNPQWTLGFAVLAYIILGFIIRLCRIKSEWAWSPYMCPSTSENTYDSTIWIPFYVAVLTAFILTIEWGIVLFSKSKHQSLNTLNYFTLFTPMTFIMLYLIYVSKKHYPEPTQSFQYIPYRTFRDWTVRGGGFVP